MKTFVITSESEWEQWRAPWDALTRANPMMSMEWLVAWWKQYGAGQQLQILASTQDEQLLGVLPCFVQETAIGKKLRLIGSGAVSSDYLSAVVLGDRAAEVYTSMIQYIRQSDLWGEFESVQFEGLTVDDPWTAHLAEFAQAVGYSYRAQPMVNTWSLSLPSSWEELSKSQKGRSVYRKAKKCKGRIDSGEIAIRELSSANELNEGMEHLVRLHQARRETLGDEGCFADQDFEAFLRSAISGMLAKGTACFTFCETAGCVISVQLLLMGAEKVFMYQSGVDPNYLELEPGHTAIVGGLENAIRKGFKEYDFLRGDEPYKAYWGAQPTPIQRIILAPPTFKAQTLEVVHRNLSWLKSYYNDLSGTTPRR